MTALRKKILHSKINNLFTKNSFTLFFQFNTTKCKEWISLKQQLSSLNNTNVLVIKNKIAYLNTKEKFTTKNHLTIFKLNKNDLLKKMLNLCEGSTLIIFFKDIEQLKEISTILTSFKHNLFETHNFNKKKQEKLLSSCFSKKTSKILKTAENEKLYSLFNLNTNTVTTEKYNFFFIGGLFENQIINYLDLTKLVNLNNYTATTVSFPQKTMKQFFHNDLIKEFSTNILDFLVLKNFLQLKLMSLQNLEKCLLNIINIRKTNLIVSNSKLAK